MAPGPSSAFRSPSAIDIAARCASAILPNGWHPRIDQTRLDLQAVIDAVRGRHPPPFFDQLHGPTPPTPLHAIDPIESLLPRALAHRYLSVRRDLRSVSDGIRGRHPAPFSIPHRRTILSVAPTQAATQNWIPVRVTSVERHGGIAATLHLEAQPSALPAFLPGQFVTVDVDLNGATHRRAYSICSSPAEAPRIAITIKRVEGGTVSGYLIDSVQAGDVLRLRGPSGSFTAPVGDDAQPHLLLFAAGSGITPMMSILRAVLPAPPHTRVSLLFGNRNEDHILFRQELDQLVENHGARFDLVHVLSHASPTWTGARGRIDTTSAPRLLDALPDFDPTNATYMLCGPEGMMDAVQSVLLERGAVGSQIHRERFLSPGSVEDTARIPKTEQTVSFRSGDTERVFVVPPGRTILEAGLDAGVPLKFSCAMGGCAACRVKLRKGTVYMPEPNALTDQERADGFVLACISHPTEAVEVEPG